MALSSIALYSFTDAEFLAVVKDNGNEDGWVSSKELALALGLDDAIGVGSRFSWMRRFGVCERDEQPGSPTRKSWRLTNAGEAAVSAAFGKATMNMLEGIKEEQLWLLSQFLSNRYERAGAANANLARRQLYVGFHRRRIG